MVSSLDKLPIAHNATYFVTDEVITRLDIIRKGDRICTAVHWCENQQLGNRTGYRKKIYSLMSAWTHSEPSLFFPAWSILNHLAEEGEKEAQPEEPQDAM